MLFIYRFVLGFVIALILCFHVLFGFYRLLLRFVFCLLVVFACLTCHCICMVKYSIFGEFLFLGDFGIVFCFDFGVFGFGWFGLTIDALNLGMCYCLLWLGFVVLLQLCVCFDLLSLRVWVFAFVDGLECCWLVWFT